MSKQSRRGRSINLEEEALFEESIKFKKTEIKPLSPKNKKQEIYLNALRSFTIVFGVGAAGTGKSYISTAYGADELKAKRVERLIFSRPNVEVGRPLGHLPGSLDEKFEPYLAPVKEILWERLGESHTEAIIKTGRIEAIPLGFMRGRTFKDAIVILDEAQNCTAEEFLMIMTRLGEGSQLFINGDTSQTDLKGKSGLQDAIDRTRWIPQVKVIEFETEDIVRSGIVGDIISSYEDK